MAEAQTSPAGPDLAQGVTSSDLTGETLLKHVGDQDVFLVGSGARDFCHRRVLQSLSWGVR